MDRDFIKAFLRVQKQGNSAEESACRCLFGPLNRDIHSEFIRTQTNIAAEEMRTKWNFDFETETPLVGRYNWEKVEQTDGGSVPLVYGQMHVIPECSPSGHSGTDVQESQTYGTHKRQTYITDYYSAKKKKCSEEGKGD